VGMNLLATGRAAGLGNRAARTPATTGPTGAGTVYDLGARVRANVATVMAGKDREVRLVLAALLCQGHVLLEDVPGVGKTLLAKAIAGSIGFAFRRLQFTADLLPADVTGVSVYNRRAERFEYQPGPLFANLVLADEINRATPRTQSALLEAMEEAQITVDGTTRPLPRPFVVLATQNPVEQAGTFPLPEAQLDRFLLRLSLGYPGHADEIAILQRSPAARPLAALGEVATIEELAAAQAALQAIHVAHPIFEYIVALVAATRHHDDVALGASPRGSLALAQGARAWAALQGRDFVLPDDVQELAEPILAHRLIASPAARARGIDGPQIVRELLDHVPVPASIPTRARLFKVAV
jgi:MoxR-like ATPase